MDGGVVVADNCQANTVPDRESCTMLEWMQKQLSHREGKAYSESPYHARRGDEYGLCLMPERRSGMVSSR